jgi:hypothetical protein
MLAVVKQSWKVDFLVGVVKGVMIAAEEKKTEDISETVF